MNNTKGDERTKTRPRNPTTVVIGQRDAGHENFVRRLCNVRIPVRTFSKHAGVAADIRRIDGPAAVNTASGNAVGFSAHINKSGFVKDFLGALNDLSGAHNGGIESHLPCGTTPLMMAAAYGGLVSVKRLLRSGMDVQALDGYGHNALFWALRWDKTDSARELLQWGSKLTDDVLCGPVRSGNEQLVAQLIGMRANPNAVFCRFDGDRLWPEDETLLGYAVTIAGILGYPTEIIKLLLNGGADANQPTKWVVQGENGAKEKQNMGLATPLEIAKRRRLTKAIRWLWEAGAKCQ